MGVLKTGQSHPVEIPTLFKEMKRQRDLYDVDIISLERTYTSHKMTMLYHMK